MSPIIGLADGVEKEDVGGRARGRCCAGLSTGAAEDLPSRDRASEVCDAFREFGPWNSAVAGRRCELAVVSRGRVPDGVDNFNCFPFVGFASAIVCLILQSHLALTSTSISSSFVVLVKMKMFELTDSASNVQSYGLPFRPAMRFDHRYSLASHYSTFAHHFDLSQQQQQSQYVTRPHFSVSIV